MPVPVSPASQRAERRGTQSFVYIISACWHRPSLLALELLWRWCFGVPLLALLGWCGWRIWNETAQQVHATGADQFSLYSPLQGAIAIAEAFRVVWPPVVHTLLWFLPLAVLAWAVAAGVGRNLVLRRYDRRIPWRPAAMVTLQLLRIAVLCGVFAGWFAAIRWAAAISLAPAAINSEAGGEPNLVLYCALVIVFSLGIFTLWLITSWIFSIAPLLVLLEQRSPGSSLARSLRLGPLTGKLVEINLVLGIVKLALMVLAMVFSAVPLPFEAQVQGASLYLWWAVVTLLYLLASDFFQVARVAAYAEMWKICAAPDPEV